MSELIAFIGVGNMGNPMVENLINSGKKFVSTMFQKKWLKKLKKKIWYSK